MAFARGCLSGFEMGNIVEVETCERECWRYQVWAYKFRRPCKTAALLTG
jgi:hypothetical protein